MRVENRNYTYHAPVSGTITAAHRCSVRYFRRAILEVLRVRTDSSSWFDIAHTASTGSVPFFDTWYCIARMIRRKHPRMNLEATVRVAFSTMGKVQNKKNAER